MKLSEPYKRIIVETICFLYILLFVYAAVSKLLDFENFKAQIGQSPLLSPFADFISVSVIVVEIIIAIMLSIPKVKHVALWSSAALMTMFTAYILIILNYSSFIPCSCGGILEKLAWRDHLIFNVVFLLIAAFAIRLQCNDNRVLIRIFVLIVLSAFVIVVLYLLSEDIMQKENPFIRRFPHATASKTNSLDLRNTTYYVAGVAGNKVYLANRKSPLQILETDSEFKKTRMHTIMLNRENFNFKAVEIRLSAPFFYVTDGTVPVIYRGLISDWKANVIIEKKFYFSDIVFTDENQYAFRTQKAPSGENIMGFGSSYSNPEITYSSKVLQKQKDGIFDTDGTLQYSKKMNRLIYTYYYRNQYIITKSNLTVDNRAFTIDTTVHAKLKVVKIKKSGDIRLGAPPYMVNSSTTVTSNLLFVNSQLRGKYEGDEVWKHATAVDVYDLSNRTYALSFYVYDEEGQRMKNFFATDSALYIISGHFLLKYGYGKNIKSKINKRNVQLKN
ncbi:putative membrane protein YphA (DoxX/SURF4 family) [Flavobacterium sp. 270]|uniref:MauE/DoxX family redox-associated membrane protein n=1 Tax=Flavobacterium sp. 270 TaxID=2512114 RepID=UPI001066AB5B|nr:MauE/DoxX family redox-associated membrane protein [Flavobacterium sp. 270]TDW46680.1 putative membrane protein YphA (DoxX/SURF4 family) [Flavobacterium sp. 270]